MRKLILILFLAGILGLMIMTWGSVGSIVLTLALMLAAGVLILKKILDNRDPDDFRWEF